MILLAVGLVCLAAALRVAGDAGGARETVRSAGAAAWAGLVALLVLVQLALGAGRGVLDGYRLTLLGFRYRVPPEASAAEGSLTVGGSYESADLWVPGAGDRPVARLGPTASGAGGVEVTVESDAGAVAMVEEPGVLGSHWRVLAGRPIGPGDTVVVHGRGETYRLVAGTVPDTVPVLGMAVAIPWVREHLLREVGADGRPGAGSALLPGVERGPLARLRPWYPSVLQRTYPLADVLGVVDASTGASLPALASFFYYRDGALHLADLDGEVDVVPAAADTSGSGSSTAVVAGRRLLVAGLPHRDYPEPDLALPERYGVRPLRSFRLERHGSWIDATLTSPEIRALDRAALEELRLPGTRGDEGSPVYRIRLAPARDALARKAVVFTASPDRFAVPGQAVLTLPADPAAGDIEVLTPSGLARWGTGRPLTLGTGDRGLLVRVDGQATSTGSWVVYGALLLLPVLLFLLRPMTGAVFALALSVMGLAGFRIVLALSAMALPPWAMEAQQLALWLLPFLPWAVAVAGEVGTEWGAEEPPGRGWDWRRWAFHGAYGLVLMGLAAVLFPLSVTKAAALGALALGTAGARIWMDGGAGGARRVWRRVLAWVGGRPRLLRGWSLGAGLLGLRVLLDAVGWREQVTVAGTRIGVSVFYTPLVVGALAAVLMQWDVNLRRARGAGTFPRDVGRALLDVGVFLLLAYLGAGAWISDFGLALVLLPGALALVAVAGFRWAPGGRSGGLTAATLALPLMLFCLLQLAPPLLRFSWGGDLQAVDARMGEWNRNELLLLERGDPEGLRLIGQRRSEALAVMRQTMRSYTRGNLMGKGYLEGRVSDEIAETATREHVPSALLASQFGLPGTVGLVLVLLSLLPPALGLVLEGRGRHAARGAAAGVGALVLALAVLVPVAYLLPSPYNALLVGLALAVAVVSLAAPAFGGTGAWGWARAPEGGAAEALPPGGLLAACALLTVSLAGLYMVLANYGLAYFTGKNVYLLGLDSLGDALEAVALLALAGVGLGLEARVGRAEGAADAGTALESTGVEWWHPSDDAEGG